LNSHLPLARRTATSARPPLRMTYGVSGWARTPSAPLGDFPWRNPDCA
jgi:hypothetical protein